MNFQSNNRSVQRAKLQYEAERAHRIEEIRKLKKRWSGREGTPETYKNIHSTPSRLRQSPLSRMLQLGKLSPDEYVAAQEIQRVVESFYRDAGMKTGWRMETVDCSGSAQSVLSENLRWIELEVAYTKWRAGLGKDAAMILSMMMEMDTYGNIAQQYGMHWRTARKRFMSALRSWEDIRSTPEPK